MILLSLILAAAPPGGASPFDTSVKPQDDFYQYVDGEWLKTTEIPPEQSRWGSFTELQQRNLESLRVLCERASASTGSGTPIERMVGDFFVSGMDESTIAAAGIEPLRFEFDRIDGLQTPAQIWAEIGHLQSIGITVGFGLGSETDPRNSQMTIAALGQGGLALPDRDYYVDPNGQALRDKYVAHVAGMLVLLGVQQASAEQQARAILALETTLARAEMSRTALRDPYARYHKLSRSQLAALAPKQNWDEFWASVGLSSITSLDVQNPDFLKALAAALDTVPVADWQAYLRWHVLHHFAAALPRPFEDAEFDFYDRTLNGIKEPLPRWKRVVMRVDAGLGEALGQLYVATYFPPESKARVLKMVGNLRAALRDRLQHLEWMDETTRHRAVEKLDAFEVKMGYPDKWRDYSGLVIDRGPYVTNVLRSGAFEARFDLAKVGHAPDRGEWHMSPPTVNAYYSPTRNEVVFPAGILQPPFFDPQASDAQNYGSVGTVIGHEMTHGFDDQGRKYGPNGELKEWWTEESAERFKTRAARIIAQFNAYEPFSGLHLNGALTAGENIADLGGIKISLAAFHHAEQDAAPLEDPEGLTPDQRFFVSYARLWRDKVRRQAALVRVRTDPHAPGRFRVNGPLSNLPDFWKAFNVPEGAPMHRPQNERVEIW